MGSPTKLSHMTLSDLERSNSRSLKFWSLISRKGAELGHMLLLNFNRKACILSPKTLSHLTLSDLERSISQVHSSISQVHSDFEALYLVREQSKAILLWNKINLVRASARGAGGRVSIPDRVTPDVKNGRFAGRFALIIITQWTQFGHFSSSLYWKISLSKK